MGVKDAALCTSVMVWQMIVSTHTSFPLLRRDSVEMSTLLMLTNFTSLLTDVQIVSSEEMQSISLTAFFLQPKKPFGIRVTRGSNAEQITQREAIDHVARLAGGIEPHRFRKETLANR